MGPEHRRRLTLSCGTTLSYVTAGDPSRPALLLLHGFPSSSRMFREIIPALAEQARIIAPDLPGFGDSEVLPNVSFPAMSRAILELLHRLAIGPRYLYVHDFGAPVALNIAMAEPDHVRGLIIQNANAHRAGFGPPWTDTLAYWSYPTAENEAAATAHLTPEGTRDQYIRGIPADLASRISPQCWEEDWRVMRLPGRMETQRALIADYGRYASRFGAIAEYLARRLPPALMLWGRHDVFFDLAEVLSWMKDLPRMECHILDAGHLLLETHAAQAAPFMLDFIRRTEAESV